MKLPGDTAIASKKLARYLLVWREEDDKSAFLSKAGYTLENAGQLEKDLRNQLLTLNAEFLDRGEYGVKYVIRGKLKGPWPYVAGGLNLDDRECWRHGKICDIVS
jgi:hypothetical protein